MLQNLTEVESRPDAGRPYRKKGCGIVADKAGQPAEGFFEPEPILAGRTSHGVELRDILTNGRQLFHTTIT